MVAQSQLDHPSSGWLDREATMHDLKAIVEKEKLELSEFFAGHLIETE